MNRNLTGKFIHNIADDKQFNFIMSRLGGERLLRQKYPELYKILLYTKEKSIKEINASGVLATSEAGAGVYGFKDSMKIRTLNYDPATTVQTASSINTVEDTPSLIIMGDLMDVNTGKVLANYNVCNNNSHFLMKETSCDSKSIDRTREYALLANTTFSKIMYDGNGKPYYYSVTENVKKSCSANFDIIKGITLKAPVQKPERQHIKQIVIRYNRTGGDYSYMNVNTKSNCTEIFFPFTGQVEFADGFEPLYVDKNKNFSLQIENLNDGVAEFNTANWNRIKWKNEGRVLSWEFPEDWNEMLPTSSFYAANNVNFYCKMNIAAKVGEVIVPDIQIVISSGDSSHSDPSFLKIKGISIEWGCFAKNTNIKMADGSSKHIQDIKAGERVRTESGSTVVTEIITGAEKNMVLIETYCGNRIIVTNDHPMLTENGWKTAEKVNAADILKMEYGTDAIKDLYTIEYNGEVFSIRTENEDAVIAEGFYAGDFGRQNRLKEYKKPEKVANEAFQQEIADLIAEKNKEMEEQHGK